MEFDKKSLRRFAIISTILSLNVGGAFANDKAMIPVRLSGNKVEVVGKKSGNLTEQEKAALAKTQNYVTPTDPRREPEDYCPICMDPIEGKTLAACPQCGHLICGTCAETWMGEKGTCPICKTKLDTVASREAIKEANRALDETTQCPICLETKKELAENGVQMTTTSCGHEFCAACLEKWVQEGHNNCPLCRQLLQGVRTNNAKKPNNGVQTDNNNAQFEHEYLQALAEMLGEPVDECNSVSQKQREFAKDDFSHFANDYNTGMRAAWGSGRERNASRLEIYADSQLNKGDIASVEKMFEALDQINANSTRRSSDSTTASTYDKNAASSNKNSWAYEAGVSPEELEAFLNS